MKLGEANNYRILKQLCSKFLNFKLFRFLKYCKVRNCVNHQYTKNFVSTPHFRWDFRILPCSLNMAVLSLQIVQTSHSQCLCINFQIKTNIFVFREFLSKLYSLWLTSYTLDVSPFARIMFRFFFSAIIQNITVLYSQRYFPGYFDICRHDISQDILISADMIELTDVVEKCTSFLRFRKVPNFLLSNIKDFWVSLLYFNWEILIAWGGGEGQNIWWPFKTFLQSSWFFCNHYDSFAIIMILLQSSWFFCNHYDSFATIMILLQSSWFIYSFICRSELHESNAIGIYRFAEGHNIEGLRWVHYDEMVTLNNNVNDDDTIEGLWCLNGWGANNLIKFSKEKIHFGKIDWNSRKLYDVLRF